MSRYKGKVLLPALWIVVIAVSAAGYFFLLKGEQRKLETINATLTAKTELYEFMKLGQCNQQIRTARENLLTCVNAFDLFLNDGEKINDLTFSISQAAKRLGLREYKSEYKHETQFRNTRPDTRITPVYLHVTFKSQFNEFAQFLNHLERLKPAIFVDKFAVSHRSGDDFESVDMVLVFFTGKNSKIKTDLTERFAHANALLSPSLTGNRGSK